MNLSSRSGITNFLGRSRPSLTLPEVYQLKENATSANILFEKIFYDKKNFIIKKGKASK